MAAILGPVHLVVIGLENENLTGEIRRELERASESGAIRVLDALAIQKTNTGSIVTLGASDLTPEQRMEYGAIVGGLLGLGATGTEEGLEAGAEAGALTFADRNFGLSNSDIQAIASQLPPGTTAAFILFEHRWALPLKDAVQNAGGVMIAQGIVRPEGLLAFGAELAAASDTATAAQVAAPQGVQASQSTQTH